MITLFYVSVVRLSLKDMNKYTINFNKWPTDETPSFKTIRQVAALYCVKTKKHKQKLKSLDWLQTKIYLYN